MALRRMSCVALAVLLLSCAGGPGSGTPAAVCDREMAAALVTRFLEAFNRGDQAALADFFPARSAFQWYSVTEGEVGGASRHFVAYSRKDLLPYFAARQRQHERLQLRDLSAVPDAGGLANISYLLDRRADDVPPHQAVGKGAVDCGTGQIFVWSMGSNFRL